ncbi:MAG: rod shape-determining protein MreD [Candidatus Tritonobacter lacicola]|nr:rod shape-determining protein MreD [Candidatus Tritonobacter lacicola]
MRAFYILVVLTVCCLLQAIAAKYLFFANIRFEFVIIAVVFFSLRIDILPAAMVGVAGGLLRDTLSSAAFGSSALSLFILAVVLSWNRRVLSASTATTQAIMVASATLFYYLVSGIIEAVSGGGQFPASFMVKYIGPAIVANALVAPLCFMIMGFIDHEMA